MKMEDDADVCVIALKIGGCAFVSLSITGILRVRYGRRDHQHGLYSPLSTLSRSVSLFL
jgi:hypothetical protein